MASHRFFEPVLKCLIFCAELIADEQFPVDEKWHFFISQYLLERAKDENKSAKMFCEK